MPTTNWKPHVIRCGNHFKEYDGQEPPSPEDHRRYVEPWLAALLQAEHANLLVGSGFTLAVAAAAGTRAPGMGWASVGTPYSDLVQDAAQRTAVAMGRGAANIEDQIRCGRQLIDGLSTLARFEPPAPWDEQDELLGRLDSLREQWCASLDEVLLAFLRSILAGEAALVESMQDPTRGHDARRLLAAFLLTFASRAGSRERLHIFTSNYDRLIEYGCDLLGLRVLDRFVGTLSPVFRSSRIGVDLHYNPPGIRGEPRYLEGVVRLTKLHGSVDWQYQDSPTGRKQVVRRGIPFGAPPDHPDLPSSPMNSLMIYPNAAKDIETLQYPYADLFRDFAAATCVPNSVLVTYGYGFGDDHINRTIRDMLTIPSTHLALISWDDAGGRIPRFLDELDKPDQTSLFVGSVFGALPNLVDHLLPKPAIDHTTWKMMELLRRRSLHAGPGPGGRGGEGETSGSGDGV